MIRTISLFIFRELGRVAALALAAFTLVMTVFTIIEPLRRQGLAPEQVLALFGYTVPGMLSLTLPIAALFAATMVYGRFAQDNELLACRASGIPTLSLLKPALILGIMITVMSLVLANMVSPKMAQMAEQAIKANVVGIVKERIADQGHLRYEGYTIHATGATRSDGEMLALRGIVAADTRKQDDMRFLTASTAIINFDTYDDQTYATIHLYNPTVTRTSTRDVINEASGPLESQLVPSLVRENPSWYDWSQLRRTIQYPDENREIRETLLKIQRLIRHGLLSQDIAGVIEKGKPYDKLTDGQDTYVIEAGVAMLDQRDESLVELRKADRSDDPGPVRVTVKRGERVKQIVTADRGVVEVNWSARQNESLVRIRLTDNVESYRPASGQLDMPQRRAEWTYGLLHIPLGVKASADEYTLHRIYRDIDTLTLWKGIKTNIAELKDRMIPKLTNRIRAEMHVRVAYGVSCFLLVAFGAALGLIFRGGQLISAFTLSMVPASVVIVMILMGKQMIRNSEVSTLAGVLAIWSGIAALVIGNLAVYLHLARR